MILEMKVDECHLDSCYGHLKNSNFRHYFLQGAKSFPALSNKIPIRKEYSYHQEVPAGSEISVSSSLLSQGECLDLCQDISIDGMLAATAETIYVLGSRDSADFEGLIDRSRIDLQRKAGLEDAMLAAHGIGFFVHTATYDGLVHDATSVLSTLRPGRGYHTMNHIVYSGERLIASAETTHVLVNLKTRRIIRKGPKPAFCENTITSQ